MRTLSEATQAAITEVVSQYSPEQQQFMAIKAIARDFYWYNERNLMIKDKVSGAIIGLELNWAQAKFVSMVIEDLRNGVPIRYIILKARQMGISTVIEALCYWWVSTHKNITAAIVAHEKPAAVNLYKMFRRFYENSHPKFQPTTKYNTKNDLTFDVEDNVKQEAMENGEQIPGLGSEIATMVAKDGGGGRSGTNHFVHGSEVAFWENSADIVSALLQTVPLAPNTFIFLESTANGIGNFFFQEWMAAEKGESQFKTIFFAWHDHREYELEEGGGMEPYTEREQKLIFGDPEMEGTDPWCLVNKGYDWPTIRRKVAWRRAKVKEFVRDPGKFDQEYPDSPMVAFLASGTYAFSTAKLLLMQDIAKKNQNFVYADLKMLAAGAVVREADGTNRPARAREVAANIVEFSPLKIYKMPVKGRKYVIGADVAEGIEVSTATGKEGDYSVADVLDAETYETVAKFRGHIDPDLYGDLLFNLGMFYNAALMGVEVNNHGLVTVQKLKTRFYPNMYVREEMPDEQSFEETRTTLLGWLTNRKTKPFMIATLAGAIRDGEITDHDLVFIGEAMVYTANERGVYGGKEGGHDDTVMAKAIALQLADYASFDVQYAKTKITKTNHKVKSHGNDSSESGTRRSRISDIRAARRSARANSRKRS